MTNTSMAYMVNWEMKAVFYIDKTTEMIQIITIPRGWNAYCYNCSILQLNRPMGYQELTFLSCRVYSTS